GAGGERGVLESAVGAPREPEAPLRPLRLRPRRDGAAGPADEDRDEADAAGAAELGGRAPPRQRHDRGIHRPRRGGLRTRARTLLRALALSAGQAVMMSPV